MLPMIRKTATAAIAALSLATAMPAPAHAWGDKEQKTLAVLLAAGVVGTLLYKDNQRKRAAAVSSRYATPAPVPVYNAPTPVYRTPAPVYRAPATNSQVRYQQPATSGIYTTPAARAFNSYTLAERKRIQQRLAGAGYYQGGIDGAFGPQTYQALVSIAGDSTGTDQLNSMRGAYEFYDTILS